MTQTASILFATNRKLLSKTGNIATFGDVPEDKPDPGLICGAVEVAGIDIARPQQGVINTMSALTTGGFDDGAMQALKTSTKNVLIFVHGASNTFEDAVTRGAYNKLWLAKDGAASDFDLVAYSWPARTYQYWNLLDDATGYRHDQAEAAASAVQFGKFLAQVQRIRAVIGTRKLNLLCHSMGNYTLGFGVGQWAKDHPVAAAAPLFDNAVLAAADEFATTFTTPDRGRLATLKSLAKRITVYFNYDDVLMHLSHIANGDFRLGYDGPPNRADKTIFDAATYAMVDCTGVNDYISTLLEQPDQSHQYYRQSPTVRKDIAATLRGEVPKRPHYDAKTNAYSLFS